MIPQNASMKYMLPHNASKEFFCKMPPQNDFLECFLRMLLKMLPFIAFKECFIRNLYQNGLSECF